MRGFLLGRLAMMALTLLVASVVVFALLNLLPGDPARFMMGLNAAPEAVAALRAELGLDRPVIVRYFEWLFGMLRGDFGLSYTYRVPVADLIGQRAVLSLPLTLLAMGLSIVVALGFAIVTFQTRNVWVRRALLGLGQAGVAAPPFVVALLLVQVFAVWLGWVSAGGFPGWGAGLFAGLKALILPAIALALPQAAILFSVLRSAMVESAREPYVTTARAKGLSSWQTIVGHILPNAMIPMLTILGLQFTFLLAGAVIIENVFYLPGLGRLVFQAVAQRDLIVVQGVIMTLVCVAVVATFVIDLLYAFADPRVRTGGQR
jgi:ABC-type dipeptide/oligopeptide/nickel transport system permease component